MTYEVKQFILEVGDVVPDFMLAVQLVVDGGHCILINFGEVVEALDLLLELYDPV